MGFIKGLKVVETGSKLGVEAIEIASPVYDTIHERDNLLTTRAGTEGAGLEMHSIEEGDKLSTKREASTVEKTTASATAVDSSIPPHNIVSDAVLTAKNITGQGSESLSAQDALKMPQDQDGTQSDAGASTSQSAVVKTKNICVFDMCSNRCAYNFPGKPSIFCAQHKEEGMVQIHGPRQCDKPGCSDQHTFCQPSGGWLCVLHKTSAEGGGKTKTVCWGEEGGPHRVATIRRSKKKGHASFRALFSHKMPCATQTTTPSN